MTSKQHAAEKIEQYFQVFPYVKRFIDNTKATTKAKADHSVQTLLGRYRRLTMINSRNRMISSQEERRCVNVLAQGGASDIARLAMNAIDQDPLLGGGKLEGGEFGIQMLLQIHDEVIQDCPDNEDALRVGAERTKYIMANPGIDLSVPLEVSGGSANSWLDAK
jgi:DNA polymerase-1